MDATRADAETLSPERAAEEILRLEKRAGSLVGRTIGLTWMIWGLVNAGLFATYEAIGSSGGSSPGLVAAAVVAWVPWVAAGGIVTAALWRSLQVVVRTEPAGGGRPTLVTVGIFLGLIFGGVAVITLAKAPIAPLGWAMFAVGLGCALAGGLGVTYPSPKERVWWLAGGGGIALAALLIVVVSSFAGYDPTALLELLAPIATTSVLLGGGWYATSLS